MDSGLVFWRMLYDDFVSGRVIFVINEAHRTEIESAFMQFSGPEGVPLRTIVDDRRSGYYVCHRDALPEIEDMIGPGNRNLFRKLVFPRCALNWDTILKMMSNLRNLSVEDIAYQVADGTASLCLNIFDDSMNSDRYRVYELLSDAFKQLDVRTHGMCGECAPVAYFEECLDEDYANLFTEERNGALSANATTVSGLFRTDFSTKPDIQYPMHYLIMKLRREQEEERRVLETGFDEVF